MFEIDSGSGRWAGMFRSAVRLASCCALALSVGCASLQSPTSGSHAAVTITGHGVTDVVLTTREVFTEHGFTLARAEPDRMIFERPGTKGEQVKYGSFGSPAVTVRAKVDLQEMGSKSFFLRCDVFAVRDAGQSVLEDETRMMLISAKSYQAILDEVKARLDGQAGSVQTGF